MHPNICFALTTALVLGACSKPPQEPAQTADVVLLGGSIITQNPAQPEATALAFKDGRVVYVGDDAHADSWISKTTKVVRLKKATVLPGLIDTHIHVMSGGLDLDQCTFSDEAVTIEQAAPVIKECAARTPGTGLMLVQDLNAAGFRADRKALDAILANRPYFLWSADGHVGWANSAALKLAGITRETRDPADGRIERDSKGDPTGFLIDGALGMVSGLLPDPTPEEREQALTTMLPRLNAAGITTYMEANTGAEAVAAYVGFARKGKLTARVTLALGSEGKSSPEEFARLVKLRALAASQPKLLRADLVKLFADGVMEYPTQSAAMMDPYLDAKGRPTKSHGLLFVEPDPVAGFIKEADEQGFGVHIHAIGDRAVRASLDGFAAARAAGSKRSYSLAHVQLVDPPDLPRFQQLDVIASLQLLWAQPDNYSMESVRPYIGSERHARMYPARSIVTAGGTIAGGSDWSVSSFNPFEAMATAISRRNPKEPQRGTLNIDQALTLQETLSAYTLNAARLLERDDEVGSLAPGKAADVIVLDRRLDDSTSADDVRAAKVVYTFLGGRMVFGPAAH